MVGRMTSIGVEDGRTAIRLWSGVHVIGAALGLLLASPTFASVTAKGSQICDANRFAQGSTDETYRLGDVNTQLIYAAWRGPAGRRLV